MPAHPTAWHPQTHPKDPMNSPIWTQLEQRWDQGFDRLLQEEQEAIALWSGRTRPAGAGLCGRAATAGVVAGLSRR